MPHLATKGRSNTLGEKSGSPEGRDISAPSNVRPAPHSVSTAKLPVEEAAGETARRRAVLESVSRRRYRERAGSPTPRVAIRMLFTLSALVSLSLVYRQCSYRIVERRCTPVCYTSSYNLLQLDSKTCSWYR